MRGAGGSWAEPVVIEMSDEAAALLIRVIEFALDAPAPWSPHDRKVLVALQAALREMSVAP